MALFFSVLLLHCSIAYETLISNPLNFQLVFFDFIYINLCFILNCSAKFKKLNENKREFLVYIFDLLFFTGSIFLGYINDFSITVLSGVNGMIFTSFQILYFFGKE